MKKFAKLLSVLLAVVLVFSLAVPAFAAEDATPGAATEPTATEPTTTEPTTTEPTTTEPTTTEPTTTEPTTTEPTTTEPTTTDPTTEPTGTPGTGTPGTGTPSTGTPGTGTEVSPGTGDDEPLPFTDVVAGEYYEPAVKWAYANGVTTGKTSTIFGVTDTCTREQAVAFLYRIAVASVEAADTAVAEADGEETPGAGSTGEEPISTANPFVDVKETDFFYKEIMWAVDSKITTGMDATHFDPKGKVTRAQIVTFLWRLAGEPTVNQAVTFKDVKADDWFAQAVAWGVANGVVKGRSDDQFDPNSNCQRRDVVTFLYRAKGTTVA